MLEHTGLLIGPWMTEDALNQRSIRDAQTHAYLGHAAKQPRTGTFRFLGGDTIKVFETQDASLLLTLRKPWAFARTWQVWDADDRRVGILYRDQIWDPKGQPLAHMRAPAAGEPGRFVIDGRELAVFESRRSDQTVLTFNESLRGDPFAKMAILGRVLLLD